VIGGLVTLINPVALLHSSEKLGVVDRVWALVTQQFEVSWIAPDDAPVHHIQKEGVRGCVRRVPRHCLSPNAQERLRWWFKRLLLEKQGGLFKGLLVITVEKVQGNE